MDNDGDVLEPQVVAARVHGNRAAVRSQELDELNRLTA
jgi:hypothetical protein